MSTTFCKNHSEKKTRFKCYHCKDPICRKCTITLSRHYFCSEKCHNSFLRAQKVDKWKAKQWETMLIWNGALTIFVLIILALLFRNYNSPAEISHAFDDVEAYNATIVSTFQSPKLIDSLIAEVEKPDSMQSIEGTYAFEIDAKRGWLVNVWRNDFPVLSEIISENSIQNYNISLLPGENNLRLTAANNANENIVNKSVFINYRSAKIELLAKSIARGNPEKRRISLTFDGGSITDGAVETLDILRKASIKTTFFLTGQFIEKNPDLVLQILKDGHEIANHTYNHLHLTTFEQNRNHFTVPEVTREIFQRQLLKTDSIFQALTGQKMRPFWRAPYGEFNREIVTWAAEVGYMHIYWSRGLDTRDWMVDEAQPGFLTPEEAKQKILKKDNEAQQLNGGIVLMHIATARESGKMYEMLPDLIDSLQKRNIEIVNITNLIEQ